MAKKTAAEEAAEKEQQAIGDYANAVINLQKNDKLSSLTKRFSYPKVSQVPFFGAEIADTLAQKEADRARQDPAFVADPDQRAFLFNTNPEVAAKKVFALAATTFSEQFYKRIANLTPKVTDTDTQKLDTAIRYKIGSKLNKFLDSNPFLDQLVTEVAAETGGNGVATKKFLKDSLKQTLEDDELADYMHFMRDVLQDPVKKKKVKSSFFSPWVVMAPKINRWVQQTTGRNFDITGGVGAFLQAGEDFEASELPGLLDKTSKQKMFQKRASSIDKAFMKWKVSKELKRPHKFDPDDLEDK